MSLFGGSSSASSDPFAAFSALMQAQAAQQQTALGTEWLNFAKEQTVIGNERQAKLDELTGQVTQAQLDSMNQANQWAGEDRARYKSVFQPLENRFIERANNWDSAASQQKAAEEARADVLSNAAQQKAAGERAMAARGIRPDSGSYAGIDRAAETQTALGAAGAANNARNQLRTQAMGLQGDALNIGRGLPSQSLAALGAGVGAGSSAAGVGLGAEGNWRGNQSIMSSGYAGAGNLYGQAGNAWGNIYNGQVGLLNQQDQMQAQSTSALMGGLGSAAGLGLGLYKSDRDAKEDRKEARGILDAIKKMPIETWRYKEGEGPDREVHVGPMAQDWKAATGFGSGRDISAIDAIGVALGGIKELAEKVESMSAHKTTARRPQPKSVMRKAA